MGVKRWRTSALDGTEWASVMVEAKAKLGVLKKIHEIYVAVGSGFPCFSNV